MLYVGATAVLLLLQARLAWGLGLTYRLLFCGQTVYWLLAFVIRPAYLNISKPVSIDLLGDPRLWVDGYTDYFDVVARVVFLGQAVYTAVLLLLVIRANSLPRRALSRSRATTLQPFDYSTAIQVGFLLYVVGLIGRASLLAGISSVASALTTFGDVGAVTLITFTRARVLRIPVWTCILALELLWSYLSQSKDALILPILALVYRLIRSGQVAKLRRTLIAVAPIVLGGFFAIQLSRGINTVSSVATSVGGVAGLLQGASVGLLERFDGFTAVTDAVVLGPGHWLSGTEMVGRFFLFLLPKGPWLSLSSTLGQYWTREVKSQTFVGQFQDVSLAAGPSAEGWALTGASGLIVENVVLAVVVYILAKSLASTSLPLLLAAISMSFSTVIYEQGAFGLAASANKATQVFIAASVLQVILAAAKTRFSRPNVAPGADL